MTRLARLVALALLAMALTSCVGETAGVSVGSDSYWGAPVYGYDLDYFYGPPPVVYGGWGPGYFVGPPAWNPHPHGWGGPRSTATGGRPPAFRPAASGRPMPSIPDRPRTGGPRQSPSRP